MAISLPRLTRKFYFWAALFLVAALAFLWYLGGPEPPPAALLTAEEQESATTYYRRLINRVVNLRQIAGDSVATNKPLTSLVGQSAAVTYQKTDLKITATEDEAVLRRYGERLSQALKPYGAARENESRLLLTALESGSPADLAGLEHAYTLHRQAVNDLLALSVPASVADLHLKLVNNLATQQRMTGNMLQVFTEPLLALESAQRQYQEASRFFQLAGEINQFFRVRGIIFSPAETIKIYLTI